MSTENLQTKWCFFGQNVPKAEIVYFCQMIIVFIIVIAAVVNLSTQNGSIELWTNTDSTMVAIKVGMEKRLLSTILLFSFAELLDEMVQQLSKKFCQGCKVEHGSQHRHECLMDSELDKLEKHFDQAFCGEKHTAKGVTKTASRKLKHEMYKNCLFDKTVTRSEMNIIRSEKAMFYIPKTINKKSLVPFDDKRWILNDGVTMRAFGHKDNI
ncbi:Hypothetical predicted protein [Mytilus galloprovincialis]|uniref:Uncharacterized protein n=1 Tax=Mytilus galloprovincialis TaxID=29158 RepID=A0A8B6GTK7_MYTGA|nr:Hypothetical predicted protein [Mytilus galloprovincialis]